MHLRGVRGRDEGDDPRHQAACGGLVEGEAIAPCITALETPKLISLV